VDFVTQEKIFNKPVEDWNFSQDLDSIFEQTKEIWPKLKGAKIFITGGTGFIGCWLLVTSPK
jgi:dTDP-glucose 4,6-dehydratase